jgi:hypothetical protein
MSSISRKIKRKQSNKDYKAFRKTVKNLKSLVKCSTCGRPPRDGEMVDDWRIKVSGESIALTCTDCWALSEEGLPHGE